MFERAHGSSADRALVPVFLYLRIPDLGAMSIFLGLAVPGVQNLDLNRDLVAIWKTKNGKRFQNYSAKFTVVDHQIISKKW